MSGTPEHEKLFEEICGKLQELSKAEPMESRFEKMQHDLLAAQQEIQDKIKNLDSLSFNNHDLSREVKRLTDQIDQERINSSKLSTDLAKSLELNLKLQFEIEEVRSKAANLLGEEKKHNQYLNEKIKSLNHELDLTQALCNETRLELAKAKEKYQLDQQNWSHERKQQSDLIADLNLSIDEKKQIIENLQSDIAKKNSELQTITQGSQELEEYVVKQNQMLKSLSEVAERKMIELKMTLDKKTIECQDYYSHLQQALTQINVLRQENTALKDYIAKLASLQNYQRPNADGTVNC